MKAHVGADLDSGTVHTLETSAAELHGSQVRDRLLHGEETSVRSDRGDVGTEREAASKDSGKAGGRCARRQRVAGCIPSARAKNQLAFGRSARNLPGNASMTTLSVGLPGRATSRAPSLALAQRSRSQEMSSEP